MEKDKELKEAFLVKKYLKELEEEKAPADFTSNVMNLIAKEGQSILVKQPPLISKKFWFLAASFVGVCLFVVLKGKKSIDLSMPQIDLSFLPQIEMPDVLPAIAISNSVLLICGIFTLMVFIQIFYLKNHFEKRFES